MVLVAIKIKPAQIYSFKLHEKDIFEMSRLKFLFKLLPLTSILPTGCTFTMASMTSIVSTQASEDFKCPEDQVETKMNDDKTVFAEGCGNSANYSCFHSGPWHKATIYKCKKIDSQK